MQNIQIVIFLRKVNFLFLLILLLLIFFSSKPFLSFLSQGYMLEIIYPRFLKFFIIDAHSLLPFEDLIILPFSKKCELSYKVKVMVKFNKV